MAFERSWWLRVTLPCLPLGLCTPTNRTLLTLRPVPELGEVERPDRPIGARRILHVNKYLYRKGGAESYMLDLVQQQRLRGHDARTWGMVAPPEKEAPFATSSLAPSVEYEEELGQAGKRQLSSSLLKSAAMVWSRGAARALQQVVSEFRPDVVHCHNIYHQLSPSVLVPVKRAQIPVVMTLHDYKLACPNYQLLDNSGVCDACVASHTLHAITHRCKNGSLAASTAIAVESGIHRLTGAYNSVDALLCPSQHMRSRMLQQGISADRLHHVPNFGIFDKVVPEANRAGFLYAGRLSHEKGVDVLVEAARSVPAHNIHIAGDGPLRSRLEDRIVRLGLSNVQLHGHLGTQDLGDLAQSVLAMVVPSRWEENQPMTILESYSRMVPAIVTDLGGLPELVRDQIDGFVVPHDDPRSLAQAMSDVAERPEKSVQMGRAGYERLSKVHGIHRHLDSVDHIYEGVAMSRG